MDQLTIGFKNQIIKKFKFKGRVYPKEPLKELKFLADSVMDQMPKMVGYLTMKVDGKKYWHHHQYGWINYKPTPRYVARVYFSPTEAAKRKLSKESPNFRIYSDAQKTKHAHTELYRKAVEFTDLWERLRVYYELHYPIIRRIVIYDNWLGLEVDRFSF